jgi:hypothetical protein
MGFRLTNHSYTARQIRENVCVAHRQPKDWSDWAALTMVRLLRWGMDFATGYQSHAILTTRGSNGNALADTTPSRMNERKWLVRFVFLESVAGVPGMVAGMLRHLHSLRRLKKDNGW